ncbi:MAG: M20/M25/M40 family metallo-hydrolase [Gemmatimonadaceae bacterium]|nr:M20/M25/M40 family metallo-hydrolase [Gemmatimonadaceae bacterium]
MTRPYPVHPNPIARAAAIMAIVHVALASRSASHASAQGAAAPRAAPATPGADVFLVPLSMSGGLLKVGVPANLTRRDGYDNQASFALSSRELYYTSNRGDGQTDIYRYDFNSGLATPARLTKPESEYSAFPIDGGKALAVIRVEADSAQRLWRLPLDASEPSVLFPDLKPVGYFAQADDSTWAMFVLGTPSTLQVAKVGRPGSTIVARNIGRSLHKIPGTKHVSFVQKGADGWFVMELDPATQRIDTLVRTLPRAEDMAWVDSTTMVMGQGTKLFTWRRGTATWTEAADFSFAHLSGITRVAVSPNRQLLALVADVVPRAATTAARAVFSDRFSAATIAKQVGILAADSMEGRRTGSRGGDRAATWIAAQFKAAGLVPAGDSGGYLQQIPLQAMVPAPAMPGSGAGAPMPSQPRLGAVASWAQWDSLPPANRLRSANVVGIIQGADPALRDEVVLVTAHYDHIGFGRAVDGDSINNGADDDASGVVAVIEMAKALRQGPRPKRTIVFMAITGEEVGGFGTRWYIGHPARPLDKTVVDLNVEMIAHADSLAGGFGKAWLTGYERSTMGDLLADNGIRLVPDPRPTQNFFGRSDNVAFARIGIPAHSLSSFNLVTPYHHPKDEPATIDAPHMAQVISATSRALRLLADGLRPEWHPGGKPEAPAPRPPR